MVQASRRHLVLGCRPRGAHISVVIHRVCCGPADGRRRIQLHLPGVWRAHCLVSAAGVSWIPQLLECVPTSTIATYNCEAEDKLL